MKIGVPREVASGERRVSLVPESVARLVKSGVEVAVERGAGVAANFPDALYEKAGATFGDPWNANVVVKVQKPTPDEARRLYARACGALRALGVHVEEGVFAAEMQVALVNDGPVTILLEQPPTTAPSR